MGGTYVFVRYGWVSLRIEACTQEQAEKVFERLVGKDEALLWTSAGSEDRG